jgi:hypothetical protein
VASSGPLPLEELHIVRKSDYLFTMLIPCLARSVGINKSLMQALFKKGFFKDFLNEWRKFKKQ